VQRFVIIGIVILILYLLGEQWNTWYQWTTLILILLLELLAYQKGLLDGIATYSRMDPVQQRLVRRMISDSEEEQEP
jgi:hypothetical protein